MKYTQNVCGSKTLAVPLIVQVDTVYIKSNIREVEIIDEYSNEPRVEYVWDEIQMTYREYIESIGNNIDIHDLAIKQNIFMQIDIDYSKPLSEIIPLAVTKTKIWVAKQLERGVEFNGKLYNATLEKQNLLSAQLSLYTINQQAGIQTPLTWNASGEPCTNWEFEDLLRLSNEIAAYVSVLVKKQQYAEVDIIKAKSADEVNTIVKNFE